MYTTKNTTKNTIEHFQWDDMECFAQAKMPEKSNKKLTRNAYLEALVDAIIPGAAFHHHPILGECYKISMAHANAPFYFSTKPKAIEAAKTYWEKRGLLISAHGSLLGYIVRKRLPFQNR